MSFWVDLRNLWKNHGWHILLCLLLLTFVILFFINYNSNREEGTGMTMSDIYQHFLSLIFRPAVSRPAGSTSRRPTRRSQTSSGEFRCKEFIEFFFQKSFQKIRPDFLKNPVTGENLELDLYNDELKLAVEYNGAQHYHYNSFMHKNSKDRFQNQQYRDLIKKDLCAKEGIRLIVVPYTIETDEIAAFLFKEFKALGLEPHPDSLA